MKIKELLKELKGEYTTYELYRYTSERNSIHTDFIKAAEHEEALEENVEVIEYKLMDEETYDTTILANCDERADFDMWYDDKDAKVLVIIIE